MEPRENRNVLIAFDEEPRPSIYIGVKTLPDLQRLLQAFTRVLTTTGGLFELSDPESTRLENIAHLVLVHSLVDDVKLNPTAEGLECTWECTSGSLELTVEMLRALETRGGPAHQYLPPDDDRIEAEIEFDYVGPPANA
jgi:hypothetical protein